MIDVGVLQALQLSKVPSSMEKHHCKYKNWWWLEANSHNTQHVSQNPLTINNNNTKCNEHHIQSISTMTITTTTMPIITIK
jgi:hypothetical protein